MANKVAKTEFDEVLCNGVDFKNRRIYFGVDGDEFFEGGEFSWESVEAVIRALHKMSSDYKHRPIELHMSSIGGDSTEMLRLYDAIHICPCQIKFYGSGIIASSATWIMAGCDERYLTPNAEIMLHKGYPGASDTTETDQEIASAAVKDQTKKLMQIYADNSRMPAEFWEEVCKRDLYLTAEETVKFGLADFIVPYKKRGNLRRKRIAKLNKAVDSKELRKLVGDINKRIQRGKNLRIELHIPEEEFDKDVFVDETIPETVEVNEPLSKAHQDASSQSLPECDRTSAEHSKDDGSEQ